MLKPAHFKILAKGKLIATSLLSTSFVGLFATISLADPSGTISPNNLSINDGANKEIIRERTVTIELEDLVETIETTTTVPPDKVDILFLSDNTGSMGNAISNVKTNAQSLLSQLSANYNDVQFGVARYYGAPKEYSYFNNSVPGDTYQKLVGTVPASDTYTKTYEFKRTGYGFGRTWYKHDIVTRDSDGNVVSYYEDWWRPENRDGEVIDTWTSSWTENVYEETPVEMTSYELQEPLGATNSEAIAAIQNWEASGGIDWQEANFFALHQAATSGTATNLGWETGYDTNWRDDAMKIIVWFGDAPSHTSDTTEAETITALNNNDIYLVAINVGSLNSNHQASNLAIGDSRQEIGAYSISNSSEVASTMQTLIGSAVSNYTVTTTTTISPTVNIDFRTSDDTPVPSELSVSYSCIDPLGCENVADGESRLFNMTITGDYPGSYDFKTEVFDVDTNDGIVEGDTDVTLYGVD